MLAAGVFRRRLCAGGPPGGLQAPVHHRRAGPERARRRSRAYLSFRRAQPRGRMAQPPHLAVAPSNVGPSLPRLESLETAHEEPSMTLSVIIITKNEAAHILDRKSTRLNSSHV